MEAQKFVRAVSTREHCGYTRQPGFELEIEEFESW